MTPINYHSMKTKELRTHAAAKARQAGRITTPILSGGKSTDCLDYLLRDIWPAAWGTQPKSTWKGKRDKAAVPTAVEPDVAVDTAEDRLNSTIAEALSIGNICVMPPKADGSKRPYSGNWTEFQKRKSTSSELESWYSQGLTGFGIICGAVSDNLEVMDFDVRDIYPVYKQGCKDAGLGTLIDRVESGYFENTPNGCHLIYRCSEIAGNTKLASRPKTATEKKSEGDKIQVLIETRGEGGYIVAAPSFGTVHPSGKPYTLLSGSLSNIATITLEEKHNLHVVAKTFHIEDLQKVEADYTRMTSGNGAGRPGDDFNAHADWFDKDLLGDWTKVSERGGVIQIRRPGKSEGISATVGWQGKDLFYSFTSSTVFEQHKPYDKFGVYALLHHNGDIQAAARELGRRGYGEPLKKTTSKKGAGASNSRSAMPKDASEIPDYVLGLNKDNFVVRDGSKTIVCREWFNPVLNRSELIRTAFTDFKNFHNNIKVQTGKDKNGDPVYSGLGSAWLSSEHRQQYSNIVMQPGRAVDGDYNLWRGFAVAPVKGSWELMQKHIHKVICDGNGELYQYVMFWLSRMIQNPEKPGEVAIVLQGGRGTGKGMFGNALSRIMGQHSCHVTSGHHVTGNFNAHLEDCIFLFADEAFWAGDKAAENVLKGLITEPTIPIERKGVDLKTVPNMLHVLMASNNDWVVPAGMDERRYFVLKVSDCHAQDHDYFHALTHEMNNGGLSAMLFDLQTMDISNFNVRVIPQTAGLTEQKIQSLDPLMNWWFQKLQDGELLHGLDWGAVSFPALYDDYIISVQKLGGNFRRASETSFAMQLRKTLPQGWPKSSKVTPINTPYGKRVNHYEFPSVALCRQQFEKLVGDCLEWQDFATP